MRVGVGTKNALSECDWGKQLLLSSWACSCNLSTQVTGLTTAELSKVVSPLLCYQVMFCEFIWERKCLSTQSGFGVCAHWLEKPGFLTSDADVIGEIPHFLQTHSSHTLSPGFPLPLVLTLNSFGLTPVKPLAGGQSFFSSLDLPVYQTWWEPQSLAHPQLIPEIKYAHFNRSWPPLPACLFQGTPSQLVQSLILKWTQVSC